MNESQVTITGNLTADPELRYVGDGTPVANFTIASTPRRYNKQTSQWEDGEAMFVRCTAWREYAENITETLSKGTRVIAYGKLTTESFTRKDGTQGSHLNMQIDEIAPSLRYATATIHRQQNVNPLAGYTQNQASSRYPVPADRTSQDSWSTPENPPF